MSGGSTADFLEFHAGQHRDAAANQGYFEMDANGSGFYVPTVTPEPSTTAFGIVAGEPVFCSRTSARCRFNRRNA